MTSATVGRLVIDPSAVAGGRRKAFTLVEVLLAMGLLMLVLAAAYAALNLFQRVTVAGRKDAEQSQLARAIERRMSADIRCVLYRESEPETQAADPAAAGGMQIMNSGIGAADDPGGTTTGSTSGSSLTSSTSTSVIEIIDPADAYATQSVGVFGDATTLVLHVSKPSREPPLPPTSSITFSDVAPVARTTDLRSISYFLSVSGASGLQASISNLATDGTTAFAKQPGMQGLARLDGDRLAIQQAEQAGGVDQLAQQATLLAAEVTELQFRYYDGTTWLTEWDSVAMKALPRAIEVTLGIDAGADDLLPTSAVASTVTSTPEIYRFVVPLQLADPTQGMAL